MYLDIIANIFIVELLADFIGGRLGGLEDVRLASRITRYCCIILFLFVCSTIFIKFIMNCVIHGSVIVAGDSIGRSDYCLGEETASTGNEKKTSGL